MPNQSNRRVFLRNSLYAGSGVLLGAIGLDYVSPSIWHRPLPLEPNDSYWANSQSQLNPELTDDATADVAVIGGGFTGLSSAYFIRQASPHKRVIVLEARGCGNGASGRNGAMVLNTTADRYMKFSDNPALDKKIYDLTAENIRFLSSLSAATGLDCELETQGALQMLITKDDNRTAKQYVLQAQALGMPVEYWNRSHIVDVVGTDQYEGAFFDSRAGQVHPMKLVQVLKTAAQAVGAEIFESTPVQHIEEGREHVLHTGNGRTIRAKSMVLATNAFTPTLGYLQNAVLPLRETIAITAPLTEEMLAQIGWRYRIPFNDSRTEVFYLGLTRDRRIHIGGGTPRYAFNNGSDKSTHASWVAALQRELGRLYPPLSSVPFAQSWQGIVDWSLDASPAVGRTGKYGNIFYGIGYSGHGVNLTSLFGRVIADLDAGRDSLWSAYPFVNRNLYYVPNEPFRWLAAMGGTTWYGLTDSK
jgi:gamma-glutamylputrescine oxidase